MWKAMKQSKLKGIGKVGDRVRAPGPHGCSFLGGIEKIATITDINIDTIWFNKCQHSIMNDVIIELEVTNQKSIMQKVSTMMKKLLDTDTQTLVKAGYINGDLELTPEGVSALNTVLFAANKAALVAMAQDKIDEEKADK